MYIGIAGRSVTNVKSGNRAHEPREQARLPPRRRTNITLEGNSSASCSSFQLPSLSPAGSLRIHATRVTRPASRVSITSNSIQASCTSPALKGRSSPFSHRLSITCPGSSAKRLRTLNPRHGTGTSSPTGTGRYVDQKRLENGPRPARLNPKLPRLRPAGHQTRESILFPVPPGKDHSPCLGNQQERNQNRPDHIGKALEMRPGRGAALPCPASPASLLH